MIYKSENVEYKNRYVDDLYKEVIAFANTNGGIIYVGVDDDGNMWVLIISMKHTQKSLTVSEMLLHQM